MPKLTSLSYRRGITLNIGSFESVRVEVGLDADLLDDEDFDLALQHLKQKVDDALRVEVRAVRAKSERGR